MYKRYYTQKPEQILCLSMLLGKLSKNASKLTLFIIVCSDDFFSPNV